MNPIFQRLLSAAKRSEADIQSDVAAVLVLGDLNLEHENLVLLEAPTGSGLRIDIEVGSTVIEVKKELPNGEPTPKQLAQLETYVAGRSEETTSRFTGILTDGVHWRLYQKTTDGLQLVSTFGLTEEPKSGSDLLVWLEGVLATAADLKPTPTEIERRLGATSSSFALDHTSLLELYRLHKQDSEVEIKRELWARLLASALGTHFEESDELFVLHTYLVMSAELIAHCALELPVTNQSPEDLLTGELFRQQELLGVVEADFFDWPAQVPGGPEFVNALARRIVRFNWNDVEHDVLKVLYESVIDADTRRKLGEYYTPDWLAQAIVAKTQSKPLDQTLLDPSCGSGTFLFWAVRRYLAAATGADLDPGQALAGVVRSVSGMDLHPVAVALARVTYVLAIQDLLLSAESRPALTIPVFLGDSLRWSSNEDLLSGDGISIRIDSESEEKIQFPEELIEDADWFDELVFDLAGKATERKKGSSLPPISGLLESRKVPREYWSDMNVAFAQLCRLHDEGRNHIWSYYIRNLARPLWFMREVNRVDVLVGNPPWLAYRNMSGEMQEQFSRLSKGRNLWAGKKLATHQDLSDLFVVRAAENYLKAGGRLAFVMPRSVLSRGQYDGFRSGDYWGPGSQVRVSFRTPWDLGGVRPHIFPVPSGVVFAEKSAKPVRMPDEVIRFDGQLPGREASWEEVQGELKASAETLSQVDPTLDAAEGGYEEAFRQGAILVPIVMLRVKVVPTPGKLGKTQGVAQVESDRNSLEKEPWRGVGSLRGPLEERFLHDCLLGTSVYAYGLLNPVTVVLPLLGADLPQPHDPRLDSWKHASSWWRKADETWQRLSSSGMTLTDQVNYMGKLTGQFPIPDIRVVYTGSGVRVVAAVVRNKAIIDSKLYWYGCASEAEAHYLCACLNSDAIQTFVAEKASQGLFGQRDIHKSPLSLIPRFDPEDAAHQQIAVCGSKAEELVGQLSIDGGESYRSARKLALSELRASDAWPTVNELVATLIGTP